MKNENNDATETEAEAILTGPIAHNIIAPANPVEIANQHAIKRIALPPGWQLCEKNDEALNLQPVRKKATATMDDIESFINYVNRHRIEHLTTVYCQADYAGGDIKFLSVINDHSSEIYGQEWRDCTVSFSPKFSEEWKRWTITNTEIFSQIQFATFLEDNMGDIPTVEGMPTNNDLLQMALNFEANQDMRFKSVTRLQNGGVQMSFVQDDDNQTLQKMEMFNKIAIGIPVFWNSDAYDIRAKLRYRVRDGSVKFWYELIRPDKVLEDATKTMIDEIQEKTSVPFFFGRP